MTVEWTEPAVSDLEGIRDFIGRDSKHYATRFVEKVIEAVENLAKFPKIGRSVPEVEEETAKRPPKSSVSVKERSTGRSENTTFSHEDTKAQRNQTRIDTDSHCH